MESQPSIAVLAAAWMAAIPASAADLTRPLAGPNLVLEERDGIVSVEAEHFHKQTLADKRAWHVTAFEGVPQVNPDGDPAHLAGASGGAYVECLPDTRRTHADKLIQGENFSDQPGRLAVLHYKVHFHTPGRYHVWVRAFSTGTEDNGLHVGLDGHWPASGQRMQWCEGKNSWRWESRQRTEKNHCGEPCLIYLDVDKAGEHEVLFSPREDGFEFDKFILTKDRDYPRPEDGGPPPRVKSGEGPPAFAAVAPRQAGGPGLVQPRQPDGQGAVEIRGELKQWHKVTLTLDGPFAHERDGKPNPFTDYAFQVVFTHESGSPRYSVPGYFAADGDAGNSSAESGTKWRAHLSPDKAGTWTYVVSFMRGKRIAITAGPVEGERMPGHAATGGFTIGESDKTGRDFRAQGRLRYVGKHHLQFAGSKEYFLKAGPDAPETLLAYADFDNTTHAPRKNAPLKTWAPHAGDWQAGDPTWKDGKGKGLIGALNYLAGKGVNAFSFLTYNAAGDGDNIWPFVERDDKLHWDCSKLDQWGVVFDHATKRGLYLHFKLQENEMDDNRLGPARKEGRVPASLDGGELGVERKLYCREIIARFGHALALNWNIGEENTQSSGEIRDMARYLQDTDPYQHPIVLHTFPPQQDEVYRPLLGDRSNLAGVSLQNSWSAVHQRTLHWLRASQAAGRPWVVANDEQNPAGLGVPPDPGYKGHSGVAEEKSPPKGKEGEGFLAAKPYTLHDIRKLTLWGNLMAGGAGVEYYFGYALPENDLVCEDFRSRDKSWDYCRIALEFFRGEKIPFAEMASANALIGNTKDDNGKYCLAKAGEVYLVYLPNGGGAHLDLASAQGDFSVGWFNPRSGGKLLVGSVKQARGGARVDLGLPPAEADQDWAVLIRK